MLVNLALGERLDKRTGLASLRSKRSSTVQKGLRRDVYTTSLAQSEAMWAAASTTPTLASPILRYYSLLQAGRAVSASSPLDNSEWQSKGGHGLELIVPAGLKPQTSSLAKVMVKTQGDGAAQKLAQALGSPLLAEPVSLLDLIAALPQQSLLTECEDLPRRPIHLRPKNWMDSGRGPSMTWADPPPALRASTGSEQDFPPQDVPLGVLDTAMGPYPSLSNLPTRVRATAVTDAVGSRVTVEFQPDLTIDHKTLFSQLYFPMTYWRQFFDVWHFPVVNQSVMSGLVLPAVGGNDRAQHPLVTWHLVLYAFSMLARYHGPFWSGLLDYDNNQDAVPLRLLVDQDSQEALMFAELAILGFLADEAAQVDSDN